jgi:hypothetical protein
MGFLKNMTIRRVTKKRFNQIIAFIENDLRSEPVVTCPPKAGPHFVIVFWDNLGHE